VYTVIGNGQDFIFKDFNRAGERIDHDQRGRLIGKSIFEVRPGAEQFGLIEVFRQVWQTGEPAYHPVTLYQDDKLSGWYENFVYKLPSGEIVAVFEDITDRKQAEEALRESERRYRLLAENATDVIWTVDMVMRATYFSPSVTRLLGFSVQEAMSRTMPEAYTPASLDRAVQAMQEELAIEQSGAGMPNRARLLELDLNRKDGSTVPVEANFSFLRDAAGRPVGILAIARDITERKRAEEALRRRAEELAALQATLIEITTPHDLPDLLQTIVERATRLLGARGGGMYVCDPGRREARCVVSYNTPHDYTGTILEYGEGAAGTVAQTGEPLIIDDYRVWGKRAAVYDEKQPFTTVLSAPMIWQNQVTGVIHVLDDVESRHFTETDLALLTLFANHAVIAVENTHLYEEAQNEITERKRAEEALRESEERYRELVENANDIVYTIDVAGKFTSVNRATERITGYTREEALTLNLVQIVSPDDFALARQMLQSKATKGQPTTYPLEIYAKDGHKVSLELSTRLIYQEGKFVGSQGIARDITERKRAEETLRESEEKYRTLVEKANEAITIAQDGVFVFANRRLSDLLGVPAGDLEGKPFIDFVWPEDRELVMANYRKRIAGETVRDAYDFRFIGAGGRSTWVFLSAAVIQWKGKPATLNLLTDITERKRAEDALRRSEEKFRLLVENSYDIIYTLTADGVFIFVSPAWTTLLGHPVTQVAGQPLQQFVHPDDIPGYMVFLQSVIKTGQRQEGVEYRVQHTDGTWYWHTSSAVPLKDEAGTIVGFYGIARDITERKRAEEALRELNTVLEQRVEERTQELSLANLDLARAVRLRDEFLANMSHELRTPLNGILGLSESLQEGTYGPLTPKQMHSLQTIESSGQRLLALVSDILDFAKIGAGKLDVRMGPVSVKSVGQASLRFVEQAAQKKHLTLTLQLDEQIESLQADKQRLRQILVNLLANAVKFTPEGGAVGLEVVGDAERGEARFTVWDTGIGIAPEDIARLFQPFIQLDTGLARHYEGAGLGLALVARLVELHSGRVWAESEPGRGSRFTVAIPWQAVGQETRAGGQVRPAATIGVANRVGDQE
jgi:PAS domain S-box-containing protein